MTTWMDWLSPLLLGRRKRIAADVQRALDSLPALDDAAQQAELEAMRTEVTTMSAKWPRPMRVALLEQLGPLAEVPHDMRGSAFRALVEQAKAAHSTYALLAETVGPAGMIAADEIDGKPIGSLRPDDDDEEEPLDLTGVPRKLRELAAFWIANRTTAAEMKRQVLEMRAAADEALTLNTTPPQQGRRPTGTTAPEVYARRAADVTAASGARS